MLLSEQAHDRAHLLKLQGNDPARLIATYRSVSDMEVDETLPPGVSFISMIDAILDRGERDKAAGVPSKSPIGAMTGGLYIAPPCPACGETASVVDSHAKYGDRDAAHASTPIAILYTCRCKCGMLYLHEEERVELT